MRLLFLLFSSVCVSVVAQVYVNNPIQPPKFPEETIKNCKDYMEIYETYNLYEDILCTTRPCNKLMTFTKSRPNFPRFECTAEKARNLRWCMKQSCSGKINQFLTDVGNTYVDETINRCEKLMDIFNQYEDNSIFGSCHRPCYKMFQDLSQNCSPQTNRDLEWCLIKECPTPVNSQTSAVALTLSKTVKQCELYMQQSNTFEDDDVRKKEAAVLKCRNECWLLQQQMRSQCSPTNARLVGWCRKHSCNPSQTTSNNP